MPCFEPLAERRARGAGTAGAQDGASSPRPTWPSAGLSPGGPGSLVRSLWEARAPLLPPPRLAWSPRHWAPGSQATKRSVFSQGPPNACPGSRPYSASGGRRGSQGGPAARWAVCWGRNGEAAGGLPGGDRRRKPAAPPGPLPGPAGGEVGLRRGGRRGRARGPGAPLRPSNLLPSPDASRLHPPRRPRRYPSPAGSRGRPSPPPALLSCRPEDLEKRTPGAAGGQGSVPGSGRAPQIRALPRAPRPAEPGSWGVSARAAGPALRRRRVHRSGAAAARGQRAAMGNSYAGQLKTTRFEEVLHNSIEASLRSNSLVPRPIFSQLYLEAEQQLSALEGGSRADNEEEEEEGDGALEQNCPPNPYQMHPPPEGCCTTDGFCQAGKDLRLVSISSEPIDIPAGFLLVGAKSPSLPDHLLVCAVDKRFLPDDNGHNALLGFSGNCVGCGKKGFCYFTEFSNHINLKLTTQPKKQKHLKYYLVRNAQGALTKGPLICWKGSEFRSRQASMGACSSSLFPPLDSSGPPAPFPGEPGLGTTPSAPLGAPQAGPASNHPALTAALGPAVFNGKDSPKHQLLVKNRLSAVPRPSALGILSNSGPPKKRHKGWSPESPSASDGGYPQGAGNRAKYESAGVTCMPQVGLVGPASVTFPVVASEEPVSVPDNLLKICKAKPVIFKGHGNFPYLCGNLNDVVVSPLLYTCYQNSQSISRAYEQYGASTIQPISEEMQLLLTVYYLVQLAADQVPLMEDLEQIFLRSWRESHLTEIRQYQQAPPQPFPPALGAVAPVTSAQLPWLAGLAASSCNDSVHVIECTYSLAEGLSEMFRLLIEGKLAKTNYVVIICACRSAAIDSCIAVTGKYQARILSESLLTPAEYQKEVNYELVTGKVDSLGAFFSTLCPEGDIDILLDKFHQENQGLVSSSLAASSVSKSASLDVGEAPACTSYHLEPHRIRPFQLAVAQKLLSHVCSIADSSTQNLDLGSFEKVDFLICIPPSEVTYQQTLFHVWHSGVLLELGLEKEHVTRQRVEQYVLKLDAEAQTKFKSFLQHSFQNPHTLFVLIHDHAHWDLVSSAVHNLYSQSDPSVGLVDRLLNCKEVKEAPNIVTLHVTSFPYALQTQHTLVSPYNEIHWPASYSDGVDLYPENRKYFGLSEFIESTLSGHSLPLLRYDSSFEAMVTALGKRFPRLHSAVIRTFVLVQHYAAAMMAVSGLSQMKNYTSVETLEITQNLINSPKQCPCGHGLMVLLRVPCSPLAAVAYERLAHVRARLALEEHFEIILGNPASGITIGKHFLKQLKVWQNIEDAEWRPQTYLELEGLPCILIFSGMDPHGESLPRSLRYCDLRLINSSCLVRTALEQELGLAAYFVSSEPPLEKGAQTEALESDAEKLSSTDNEDEELVTEGGEASPGSCPHSGWSLACLLIGSSQ